MCGLDPKRLALTGAEMRPCWIAAPAPVDVELRWTGSTHVRLPGDAVSRPAGVAPMAMGALASVGGHGPLDARSARRPRTFVPVDDPEPAAPADLDAEEQHRPVPAPVTRVPGTWWLWGDPEPWPDA